MRITLLFSVIPFLLLSQPKEEYPFFGNFDLGLSYYQAVEKTLVLTNEGSLRYKIGEYEIKFTNKLNLLRNLGKEGMVNNGEQKIKWNLKTKKLDEEKLEVFISSAHLYDIKQSIKKRFTNEVGINFILINKDKYNFKTGVAFLNEDETSLENIQKNINRISGKLNYTTNIGKRIKINSKNDYRPNIEKFGDFAFDTELDFVIKVNAYWRIKIENELKYTSYPATGIPEIHYVGINTISYVFFW